MIRHEPIKELQVTAGHLLRLAENDVAPADRRLRKNLSQGGVADREVGARGPVLLPALRVTLDIHPVRTRTIENAFERSPITVACGRRAAGDVRAGPGGEPHQGDERFVGPGHHLDGVDRDVLHVRDCLARLSAPPAGYTRGCDSGTRAASRRPPGQLGVMLVLIQPVVEQKRLEVHEALCKVLHKHGAYVG